MEWKNSNCAFSIARPTIGCNGFTRGPCIILNLESVFQNKVFGIGHYWTVWWLLSIWVDKEKPVQFQALGETPISEYLTKEKEIWAKKMKLVLRLTRLLHPFQQLQQTRLNKFGTLNIEDCSNLFQPTKVTWPFGALGALCPKFDLICKHTRHLPQNMHCIQEI